MSFLPFSICCQLGLAICAVGQDESCDCLNSPAWSYVQELVDRSHRIESEGDVAVEVARRFITSSTTDSEKVRLNPWLCTNG